MTGPKEAVYDTQIAPLIAQVLDLCEAHGIGFVMSFALDQSSDGSFLLCSSSKITPPGGAHPAPLEFHAMIQILRPPCNAGRMVI